jgi:hypothetical protein
VSFQIIRTQVALHLASSPWPEADALVLPTNDYLWMSAGPPLSVKQLAGEEVELSAVRQGPAEPGEVVLTEAGGLPLQGVLHAVVMGQDLAVDPDSSASAMGNALVMAARKKWTRILVHSLLASGRGTRRETVQRWLAALVEHLLAGSDIRHVTLLATDEADRKALHDDLLRAIQKHE